MSKESYIRGFCKAAEAHGINPVLLLKVAQLESISDGYFQYNPTGKGRYAVDDIYHELYPELEESMTDFSGRSNPASKLKPAGKWIVRNGNTPQPQVKSAPVTKPRPPAAILKEIGLTPERVRAMNQAKPSVSLVKGVTAGRRLAAPKGGILSAIGSLGVGALLDRMAENKRAKPR